jgi:hypothetical protein
MLLSFISLETRILDSTKVLDFRQSPPLQVDKVSLTMYLVIVVGVLEKLLSIFYITILSFYVILVFQKE